MVTIERLDRGERGDVHESLRPHCAVDIGKFFKHLVSHSSGSVGKGKG